MKEMHKSAEFEELFDRAVSRYAPPEPRPGLEQRILAHLEAHAATQTPPGSSRWLRSRWFWITSSLATATVAVSLVLILIPSTYVSPSDSDKFGRQQSVTAPRDTSPTRPRQASLAFPARKSHRLPSSVVSTEPTPQERLLSEFAARHPQAALNLAKTTASENPPISVAPLTPEPIRPEPIRLEALSVRPIHIELIDMTVQEPPASKGEL